MSKPSIAIVSREIAPFVGGGIAPVVRSTGELLAERGWDVTFLTDASYRERFEALRADPEQPLQTGVSWRWVEGGDAHGDFSCWPHFWSARVDAALREIFPERAPDVIEFSDYLAEGFVTTQRRAASDPWLDHTTVAVRIHTSSEICSVLNGVLSERDPDVSMFEMERYCLTHADRVLHQGGDVATTYNRYYAGLELAPTVQIKHALPGTVSPVGRAQFQELRTAAVDQRREPGSPLHLLYLGRTERRKGIVELAESIARRPDLEVQLDIVGGDTDTGPLATSVREHLQLLDESDWRITVHEAVPANEVPALIGAADAVVVPSRWECWPNVAFESLLIGRPVIATPVGGLREIVVDGVTGLLGEGNAPADLEALLERAIAERDELRMMPAAPAYREHLDHLFDLDEIVSGYTSLLGVRRPRPLGVTKAFAAPSEREIAVVIPYFRLNETLEATLQTLAGQDHRELDVVIVNDGSLRKADEAVFELADQYGARVVTVANGGLSSARNVGIRATSAPYLCMLDADDELDPRFLSSCLHALEQRPELAYATTWVRYIDEDGAPLAEDERLSGYFPFGNWTSLMGRMNLAGVCTSVMRRSALERHGLTYDQSLASYEDWDLYRQLAERAEYGAILPERWFHYRVRRDSMTRQDAQPHVERLVSELRAANRYRTVAWMPEEHVA